MPRSSLTGTRLRQRRMDQGLKQAELAQAVGISASYLNLIEHNRRRIAGKLLSALSEVLNIDPQALQEGGAAPVVAGLRQIAGQSESDVEADQIEEFAGRFPGWADQMLRQQDRIGVLERTVQGLNDRLIHDPILSEKMHEVLSTVAAIRSTASILMETPDIAPDWRQRFHANIDTESRRLADTSAAMAGHLERLNQQEDGFATPLEALDLFFSQNGYCLEAIEKEGGAAVDTVLDQVSIPGGPAAAAMIRSRLQDYAAVAERMPLHAFLTQAQAGGFDPGVLSTQFRTDLPTIFRRLAHLPTQPDLPEIGYVECDSAGAFLMRRPAPGFPMPRFGAACPLWPLFAALGRPNLPLRDHLTTVEGKAYDAYAIALPAEDGSFSVHPVLKAMMVLVETETPANDAKPVGASCRVCPREACTARREPSILHKA